jgi:hypothetical protein
LGYSEALQFCYSDCGYGSTAHFFPWEYYGSTPNNN